MPSTFTWLDYSEQHRRRMLDVIDLFSETQTRDELGIGSVRDAFAEQFFPSISVVHTRARYLLFIPWIYIGLERRSVPSARIAERARREEVTLINVLAEATDNEGTIGIEARENLQRLPSSVYWQALGRLGIRLVPGYQDAYHRSFDAFHNLVAGHRSCAHDRQEAAEESSPRNWHAGLPVAPEGFPVGATFELTRQEAHYLRERMLTAAPGSLLADLVHRAQLCERTDFPWQHPYFAEFPGTLRERLQHARHFSLAVHGAPLLYNLMLAERTANAYLQEAYGGQLRDWAGELEREGDELARWDRSRFWATVTAGPVRVSLATREFVNQWLDLALAAGAALGVAGSSAGRQLIHTRERQLKGPQARLDSLRAAELWNGASGVGRLDYRWRTAQIILNDILCSLGPEGSSQETAHA